MNVVEPRREEFSPLLQLLLLLAYAVAGALIFSLIGLAIAVMMYGFVLIGQTDLLLSGAPQYLDGLKLIQILSAIGTFVLPPLALALTQHQKINGFYLFRRPTGMLVLIMVGIMILSMPFMEWIAISNQKMVLPDFLKGVEQWMKEKEAAASQMISRLIMVRNHLDFIVNIIMIAIIPAIGEELMFRGGVQRSLQKTFDNPHTAIWISAIIFSAFHLQFYGFIPRMLLGAGFGYLYYYSGSIWYAMLAHFLNNAYAVCIAYYMQLHHMPLAKADEPMGFPWYGYLISAIITLALFKLFKNSAERERKLG